MRQVSCGHFSSRDGGVKSALASAPGVAKSVGGVVGKGGVEAMEHGSHDAGVRLAHEQTDTSAGGREEVAVGVGHAVHEPFETKPTEVVAGWRTPSGFAPSRG